MSSIFRLKQFSLSNTRSAMRVTTDGMALGAWCECPERAHVLDAGCGTGLIALMLAQRYPTITIDAIDIDADTADEARDNVAASPWADRITVRQADFAILADADVTYDVIVSNPPFFSETIKSPDASRALSRSDGDLSPISLIKSAHTLLSAEGQLSLIAPSQRDNDIAYHATMARLSVARCCRLISVEGKAPVRTLWTLTRAHAATPPAETLTIRHADGTYTDAWHRMLQSYYINF